MKRGKPNVDVVELKRGTNCTDAYYNYLPASFVFILFLLFSYLFGNNIISWF
jgi:hypothetical protein